MKILLTGGSGGIGSHIKEKLTSEGHTVVSPSSTDLDLSNPNGVHEWLSKNAQLSYDGLVLCAGVNSPKAYLEVSDEDFARSLEINLNSSRKLVKALLPFMVSNRFGRIIAISSAYAQIGRFGRSSYSISKAGLEALIRSVAVENGQSNILANVIAPGFIKTPLTEKNNDSHQIEEILKRVPISRLGLPGEVANLVKFLMGEENTYITGQTINIDGGFSVN